MEMPHYRQAGRAQAELVWPMGVRAFHMTALPATRYILPQRHIAERAQMPIRAAVLSIDCSSLAPN